MSMLTSIKRALGIDTRQEDYTFTKDPRFGHIATARVAEKWVKTTCGYCSVGCGMLVGVKDGKAVAARGNPDHPVNLGKLCPKGLSEHHVLDAPGRATQPLLRKDGKLVPVSWDEALDVMVEKFTGIQAKYGREALGVVGTGQLLTEDTYTLGKLVQLGFGTRNNDGNTTLCMASAVSGYKLSFGSDGPPGSYADMQAADVILLIGANIADNHPILCHRLDRTNRKGEMKLIVVDPRVTKTAMMADIHLPVKPRSDIALINGIAHVLIRDGLVSHDYIAAHTDDYAEFATFVEQFTPKHVAAVTGLSEARIVEVAHLYGNAKAAFIGWTMGVNHSTQGAMTVAAINNLALITGHIGRGGAAPFSITGQCNAMGTRETGFTSSLPGYRKYENAEHREELARLWGIDVDRIPSARGMAYPDIIEGAVAGKIKALWFVATNPVVSFPNFSVLDQALRSVEFLVVQDGFHPTPTSDYAHLVLPAAIWGEKEGTYTNSERRVSKVNAIVTPPGEARPDFDIFLAIAERLGVRDELYPGWTTTADAFREWQRVSAGRMCDYSGFTWQQLEDEGGAQWGGERLYADGVFPTATGRAKLHCVPCLPFAEQPDGEYNFVLNTGRTVEHWHTRTKTANIEMLDTMVPQAWLEMNPVDAAQLKLKAHDRVTVVSRRSAVNNLELRITGIVAPGQVFMPFHFSETNSNLVTLGAFDPISREPNFKQCAVRVEKFSQTLI
ncbi:nitrate reductase (quinol-dependent), catalytic subunit [Granulicella rosea]|uniref:Nitrate reductase (Quinol-dependent), catalytic subunit n=1 Tax=Granulicella rosea TaxID=474952 RepID=A0A239EL98_9BACT|nr:molybdopterin-dependent oxidoreductase [Granulicella rosea]SNS45407.1 nitrate reductase (quinol-dependent), catalytic subunit [Granulicella rosea]